MTGSRVSRGTRSILFTPSTAGLRLRLSSAAIHCMVSPTSTLPPAPAAASTRTSATSTSESVESAVSTMRLLSGPLALWMPGVSKSASW